MNDNNNSNNGSVRPYKASGNLNTIIGNPSVNINNTMDVNIQSMATNKIPTPTNNNTNNSIQNIQSSSTNTSILQNSNQNVVNNTPISSSNINYKTNVNNVSNNSNATNQDKSYVTKKYVGINSKPKKKNVELKIGSEFKIALLIIVILMVFVFLLPKISEIFGGY